MHTLILSDCELDPDQGTMHKLILSDCELDPDQGTYFIESTDPIFNNFVRDHVYLLDLNWIQADHVGYEYGGYDPYNYCIEVSSSCLHHDGKRDNYGRCEFVLDFKNKYISVKSINDDKNK